MNKIRNFFSNTDNLVFLITWISGIQMGLALAQFATK